ncbi:MAG TPA: hypothetical protein VMT25_05250 [Thermoanaerobaculia bacterium]|nr:hypothetical protein [Thermoanaerobaculia bacterium]
MKRTILAAVIVSVALATAARAQDKTPTAPAAIVRTPVAPKTPAMPRPGPEVEKLSYFVGVWSSTGHMKPSPLGEGGDTRGRDSCGWMPGKFFVGCMMLSESPMGRIQSEAIMGWDSDKKVYSWTSFDSTGRHETATGVFEKGVWTWSSDMKMGDKTMKTRYVISDTTPEGYAFRWETSADGKEWKSLLEGQVTKAKPPVKATPGVTPTPEVTPAKAP